MPRLLFILALLVPAIAHAGDTATSADGKWLAIANSQPYQLAIISTADRSVVRLFDITGKDGTGSRVEGVYTDPRRRNFIITLMDAPEYWLIATDPDAPPVYEGFVHSREAGMIEALPSSQGLFARQRVLISTPLANLTFGPTFRNMIGLSADGQSLVTVNLHVNREISITPVKGKPGQ